MNKIWNAFMRHPKKVMLALALVVTGLLPVASNAWGPSRPEFKIEKPAKYVVFNSITNAPVGDERNFVRIKPAEQNDSALVDQIELQPGKKYTVDVYYHNNAAANLKLEALNTRVKAQVPSVIKAGTSQNVSAIISADNANPKEVWDEAKVSSKNDVALRYVPNSAKIYNKNATNGMALNATALLGSTGALIGDRALDGKVMGCNQYSGHIQFTFQVDQPNLDIKKEVSLMTTPRNWQDDKIDAKLGDTVEYRITYTNNGTTSHENVVIKDALPAGVTYIKGSTKLANGNTGWTYATVKDDNIITSTGINIGNYAPGAQAQIKLAAKIDTNYGECGKTYQLVNTAYGVIVNGSRSDKATVVVKTNDCPPAKTIQVCRLSDKKYPVTIKESEFDAKKYSKNKADCDSKPVPEKIEVCRLADKKIIEIDRTQFDNNKHSKNLEDCKAKPVVPVTPVTPSELPKTGIADTLSKVIGLGSLVASAGYYLSSRKLVK